MKKVLTLSVLCFLSSFSLFAQSKKYVLKIRVEQIDTSVKPSFLIIPTTGRNFIMQQVTNGEYQFNLDTCFSYPQPGGVSFYPNCNEDEIKNLKSYGGINKPHLGIGFFITDTIYSLVVRKDTVLLLNPNTIQKKYWQIEDEIGIRIDSFNKSTDDKLHEAYKQAKTKNEKDSIRNLSENLFKTNVAKPNLDSTLMPAIRNNLNNAISLYAMDNYLYIARVLQLNIPVSTFKSFLKSMPEQQKQYERWKELNNTINAINPAKTLIGKAAPEFVNLKDTSGKIVHLKDFKGKVVVIDFWASWCGPCMAQIPKLKNIYHNVQDKNVVFIGISWDYALNAWKNEIKKSALNWINIVDLKGFRGVAAAKYNITTIPHNFLIDKNGIIVDEEIPLDTLETKIENLL